MNLTPIGKVRSEWERQAGTPVQPSLAPGEGWIEIDAPYRDALADLDGFERIWVVSWLDRAAAFRARVVPYRDTEERGLFACRAPCRPNPIGISAVQVIAVDPASGVIRTGPIDLLDGTPVLDVKPYVPLFDAFPGSRAGWLDEEGPKRDRADGRFEGP